MKKDISVIRESIGRIVSMLTKQSVSVTMRGANAYVSYHPKTGAIIGMNIPYIPDDASDEFIAAIQGFLDHEVGHVLFSSPKVLIAGNKFGKRVANLHNIIEDVFIERKMTEAFRGSGLNLESTRVFYLERIARPKIQDALRRESVEEARGYATVAAFRGWGGQASAMDFVKEPAMAALVAPVAAKLGPDLIARIAKCNSSEDCLALARLFKDKLEVPKPPPPPPPPAKDMLDSMDAKKDLADAIKLPPKEKAEDEGTTKTEADDSGKTGAEPAEKLDGEVEGESGDSDGESDGSKVESGDDTDAEPSDKDPAGMGTESSDESEGSDEGSASESGDPADEGKGSVSDSGESGEEPTSGKPATGTPSDPGEDDGEPSDESAPTPDPLAEMFDESRDFDEAIGKELSKEARGKIAGADYAVFSTEWDTISPAPLAKDATSVATMDLKIRNKVGVMQKQLERGMAAKARKSWTAGKQRGRIAPGSLFKVAAGDDRVFRQRFETQARSTAVSLVVDCSGSMCGSRIALAGIASYALSVVLERLRITHEVIGFTSAKSGVMTSLMASEGSGVRWSRREPIYMPVFKPFSGKLDSSAKSRIAHLTENPKWLLQNIDGESVNLAARRLVQQTAERHVMIVLSDGDPCCSSGRGLDEHLKKTVKRLEKQGIEMIGIGIQTHSVSDYYAKHVILNDVEELPTRLMGELTKLLLAS